MNLINRRNFFKKAISKCLPILGALVATALPIKADTIPNGCNDNCSNSCQRRCSYTCASGCTNRCLYMCVNECSHKECIGKSNCTHKRKTNTIK